MADAFTNGDSAELVDPDRVYVSRVPECEDVIGGYRSVDRIEIDDPVEELRRILDGVLATDVIEEAGYPDDADSSREWWRIVREGRVVAGILVGEQGGGIVDAWSCESAGITLPSADASGAQTVAEA